MNSSPAPPRRGRLLQWAAVTLRLVFAGLLAYMKFYVNRVRQLHDLQGISTWAGTADVERGRSLVSRLAGAVTRLPPAGGGRLRQRLRRQ